VATNCNQPDFIRNLELFWGGAYESDAYAAFQAAAANVIVGTNPPWGLGDLLSIFPKFFGPAVAFVVTAIANNTVATVTTPPSGATLAPGQLINDPTGTYFPKGTTILSVSGGNITLSNAALASASSVNLFVYPAPWLPLILIQLYITLASSSLVQARWNTNWYLAMALFVAHYCTLWMDGETGPNLTASQIATSGLQMGIMISQAAGDTSAGLKPIEGLEIYGAWNLTRYGIQLATLATGYGAGIMYIL
jgi:hypothetical protein